MPKRLLEHADPESDDMVVCHFKQSSLRLRSTRHASLLLSQTIGWHELCSGIPRLLECLNT